MALVPVEDAGKRTFFGQLSKRDAYARGTESDGFGGFADAEHGYTFAGDKGVVAQVLQGIDASVVFGNHAQTGRPAIHGIELGVMTKCPFHCLSFSISNELPKQPPAIKSALLIIGTNNRMLRRYVRSSGLSTIYYFSYLLL